METALGTKCSMRGAKLHFQIGPLKLQFEGFRKCLLHHTQLVEHMPPLSKQLTMYCLFP